jgi:hypothetical protein
MKSSPLTVRRLTLLLSLYPLDFPLSAPGTPRSILHRICNAPDESKFHALIDTGALITGMTNLEVAQFLLNNGLSWCEGVVFLDSYDRKMVLVRSTRRVLKMTQCGIPPEKRFAFYDQVLLPLSLPPFLIHQRFTQLGWIFNMH